MSSISMIRNFWGTVARKWALSFFFFKNKIGFFDLSNLLTSIFSTFHVLLDLISNLNENIEV
ncbi:hypothetical protein Lalb_Chr17g0337871 [Lupinus albus]|uniref:Uncharacterized protein n=1 Tax=Lupinus albus TaxID=3870 RepID=A0A6A4P178_LUPAL|nr:hypothetical protein Lalb_Chr17g0337871 [Lupinus albus]